MADYYSTGTVSVLNGGTTVTGSGVVWSTVQAGDTLELAGQRVTISAVPVSPYTSLTLAVAWTGTTQSGASYVIRYDAPARFTAGYLATQVRELVAKAAIIEAARPSYGVVSVGSNTPPSSPVTNDMYVVGTSPTGAWSGQSNNLAQWTGSAWQFTAPTGGTTAVSEATNGVYVFSGTAWNLYVAPSSFIATLMDDADAAAARTTLDITPTTGMTTPTPTASSGTMTTATSSLFHEKTRTRVYVRGWAMITTAGTGAGELRVALPFTCGLVGAVSGNARESQSTGVSCQVIIQGYGTYLIITRYDGASIIANGRAVQFEITYDAAS